MVSSAFPNRPFNLRDNVWFMQTDVANNRSLVGWELWIDKVSYSPTFSSGNAWRWLKLNGGFVHEYFGSGYDFRNGTSFRLANGTTWIPHNADGTKSLLIEAAADFALLGATSLSVSIPLPTIPRASTATFSNPSSDQLVIGQPTTVNTNRASTNFTHDIDWYFGSDTGRALTGVGASAQWTVPNSFLTILNNATVGVGRLRTHTYNGGTMIGWTESSFRVSVPASYVPTIGTVTAVEATPGVAANVGTYVKGISTLTLNMTGTAGVSGSTITSRKIEVLSGTKVIHTINGASGTTGPLAANGTLTVRGSVTDSRGRTTTKSITINVLNYNPPTISSASVARSLSNGTIDADSGTYLRVAFNATVSSLMNTTQRNALGYRIYTRTYGTSTWTQRATQTTTGVSFNSTVVFGTFSLTSSYEVRVDVFDDFKTSSMIIIVPVAEIFMHWDGTAGVGVGKFRQNGRLDVLGDTYTSGKFYQGGLRVLDTSYTPATSNHAEFSATYSLADQGSSATALPTLTRDTTYSRNGSFATPIAGGFSVPAGIYVVTITGTLAISFAVVQRFFFELKDSVTNRIHRIGGNYEDTFSGSVTIYLPSEGNILISAYQNSGAARNLAVRAKITQVI